MTGPKVGLTSTVTSTVPLAQAKGLSGLTNQSPSASWSQPGQSVGLPAASISAPGHSTWPLPTATV